MMIWFVFELAWLHLQTSVSKENVKSFCKEAERGKKMIAANTKQAEMEKNNKNNKK